MGSTTDVFDWASVVLSNNYMKLMSHEDRNKLLHSILEPYEISIIADRDKIILDGPWGTILKSKVKLSEYLLETNRPNESQTIESVMESSSSAIVKCEEILTDDALEISCEETFAETLSVYETAMLLKHRTPIDVQSSTRNTQIKNVKSTSPQSHVAAEKEVQHNVGSSGHEGSPKETEPPQYQEKDPSERQRENVLSDDEKEIYITIELSTHEDDFQDVVERLGRPATMNLDEITDEVSYSNESFERMASEDNKPDVASAEETQTSAVAVNMRVGKRSASRHRTRKSERGYRITRKDPAVDGTFQESPNIVNKLLEHFRFSCDKCSLKTNQRSYYLKHMKLHEKNSELLSCNRCNYKTIGPKSLGRHMKTHIPLKLSCDVCNYQTNETKRLENHKMKKHKGKERIYECVHCDFSTPVWYQIKRHVQEHVLTEDSVFRCQQCPYTSPFKRVIGRHIKSVHLNVKPFLCDTCGKKFKRQDNLKTHAYLHTPAERKFPCPICAKVYVTSAYLASHMISHSKERPFLCEICGASFKMLGTQRKHTAIVHKNPGRFSCDNCGRKFNRKFTLIRHMKIHRLVGSVKERTQILPMSLLGSDQIALITTKSSQTDPSTSFQGEAIMLPDSSQVIFESQPTITVMEGQLDAGTMTILAEVDEGYDVSQGETATALLYLTNN